MIMTKQTIITSTENNEIMLITTIHVVVSQFPVNVNVLSSELDIIPGDMVGVDVGYSSG